MDKTAKKFTKQLKYIGYFGIFLGFLGMVLISYELLKNFYNLIFRPETMPQVGIVLPIEAKGIFFVPFFYWILSIFVIALVHEFSHGILARTHNLRIKSSGFAFLGIIIPIIPAAFVEPDEKKLAKRNAVQQLSIFAAGPFSNIILGFIMLLVLGFVFSPVLDKMIELDGVEITELARDDNIYPAELAGMEEDEIIKEVDATKIIYVSNFSNILSSKKPGDNITIVTDKNSYVITLTINTENNSQGYLGVYVRQHQKINDDIRKRFMFLPDVFIWITGLVYWLFLLNLGIGLFNLVPIGPLDGGRMLRLLLTKTFKKKRGEKIWKLISFVFLVIIIMIIFSSFLR